MADVRPAGGIDLWPIAIDSYELNFPNAKGYCCPIENLSARRVAREVGEIDFLLASPECTNHSVAKGNAPRCEISRRTAFELFRFARAMQPRWIVVENVTAMRRWSAYPEWLSRLKRLGYNVVEAVLDASDFGVPQTRRRLFVICDREQQPSEPEPYRRPRGTVRSILMSARPGGGKWTYSRLDSPGRAQPTLERAKRAILEVGPKTPFLLVYYGSDAAGGWQRLNRPLRTITTLDRFALVKRNGVGHVMRMLQPPELAAAMGFPSDYKWPATTRRNQIRLIGNAVSPPVMHAIIAQLIRSA